jgi:ABC-type protease/lipase transport system fused ATPase/permease subunit
VKATTNNDALWNVAAYALYFDAIRPAKERAARKILRRANSAATLWSSSPSHSRRAADAMRAIGVTEAAYNRWRNQYGGLQGDQRVGKCSCAAVLVVKL